MNVKPSVPAVKKPCLVIVGDNAEMLPLVERFEQEWSVTILLREPTARSHSLSEHLQPIYGELTNTLVLREAGLDSAKAIVAASADDDINLEVCRLAAKMFNVEQRIAFVSDQAKLARFAEEGVETIHTSSSLALAAESKLKTGAKTATDVGLGQGELYQVEVLPGSTAIGKTPRLLNPQSWLIAAIYRGNELIVPHGDTLICEGDSILLVGQPDILPGIANFFKAGTSEFPLQYGAQVVGLSPQGADPELQREVEYLAHSTEATGYCILQAAKQEHQSAEGALVLTPKSTFQAQKLARKLDEFDSGCTVMKAPPQRWYHRLGLGESFFFRFMECHNEPAFISRGTYPYRRITLGVQPGRPARFAAEMAVDLARGLGSELRAVAVVPSTLVTGDGYENELDAALNDVVRLGEVYGLQVQTEKVSGNPVLQLEEVSRESDLLVVAHKVGKKPSLLNPDVSRHVILRSHCSVLCLPHNF